MSCILPEIIDVASGNEEKTISNLQKMITLAKENNSQVVSIAVPELGLFLNDAAFYQVLPEKNQIPIASSLLCDILGNNALKSDHLHLNADGYQILAEKIALLLKNKGAIRDD